MPRTRLYGHGTIRLRKDGYYEARLPIKENGRRKQRTWYSKSLTVVDRKLRRAMRARDDGTDLSGGRMRVAKFLERWLQEVARGKTRPQTFDRYRELVRVHLAPALGAITLEKLSPLDVQGMLNAKAKQLAPRTVGHLRAVLRNALNQARRWDYVTRNVAELVDPPRIPDAERRTLSFVEAQRFLAVIRGDRLEAVYAVGLSLGLRMGEVLALRWDDVDLVAGVVTIRHSLQRVDGQLVLGEPKTSRSRRTLPLPAVALRALADHRARQQAAPVQPGPPWRGLVFTTADGRPLEGSNVVRALQRLLTDAGLPRIRFHDLRHSCASLLVAQGVPMKSVQEILGHSRIGTTADLYTHFAGAERAAVLRHATDTMDRLLPQ